MTQMLELARKDFKAAILTMFKNAKANMLGFLSQGKKKKKTIKEMQIQEVKNKMSEIKFTG